MTNRSTMRRVIGATSNTNGNAINQAISQAPIQSCRKSAPMPDTRNVDIPDTTRDINLDRMKPNKAGTNRAGSHMECPSFQRLLKAASAGTLGNPQGKTVKNAG